MSTHSAMAKEIYRGRLITLGLETLELPGGVHLELEIVRHPGGAVVLAANAHNEICLLRQYRHAIGETIWELPAGTVDAGEKPSETAKRELEEEAGVKAEIWRELGSIWPTPGFCDEVLHLYLAQQLDVTAARHNRDELIEIHWFPIETALSMAKNNEINDGKTLAALFRGSMLL